MTKKQLKEYIKEIIISEVTEGVAVKITGKTGDTAICGK